MFELTLAHVCLACYGIWTNMLNFADVNVLCSDLLKVDLPAEPPLLGGGAATPEELISTKLPGPVRSVLDYPGGLAHSTTPTSGL